MKKVLIAVFAVAAGFSVAGAQERAVNFEGAAVPMPKMERVQGAEAAQLALAGAATPQRMIVFGKVDKASLAKLLRVAGNERGGAAEYCYPGGTEVMGNMVCMMKCCDVDYENDGIMDTSYCVPHNCKPMDQDEDKALGGGENAAIKAKALQLGELIRSLKNKKKTRGPYEDCVNYCIDAYLGCSGDPDPKPCNDSYQRCINVCDKVVNN